VVSPAVNHASPGSRLEEWRERRKRLRTEHGFKVAVQCFREAIARDANYAPAVAGLADAYSLLGLYAIAMESPNEAYPKAREFAVRALKLDNTLAEARCALAVTTMNYDWDWPMAELTLTRAMGLNSSDAILREAFSFPSAVAIWPCSTNRGMTDGSERRVRTPRL
jgi:tetratricopeptide (TPR) repeat protein